MSYLKWNTYNYAGNFYNLRMGAHYIIPKPKFLFYVDFKLSQYGKQLLSTEGNRRLGFMLKSLDRPSIQYQNQELNQYNRKRLVTTGVNYGPVSMTIHDTVDEPALRLMLDYSRFYYHDFSQSKEAWRYDIVPPMSNKTTSAGVKPRNGASDMYFFDSIDCYEWYNGYYTKYTLVNPRFETVQYSPKDMGASEGDEVSFVIRPEAVVWEKVNAPITREVSDLFGIPFKEGSTNTFRPDIQYPATGVGIPTDFNGMMDSFYIGDAGSFITNPNLGDFSGAVSDIIGNVGSTVLNNFLYQSGYSSFNYSGNSLIGMGTRVVSNMLSGIF